MKFKEKRAKVTVLFFLKVTTTKPLDVETVGVANQVMMYNNSSYTKTKLKVYLSHINM
jgi:hypothetical protein